MVELGWWNWDDGIGMMEFRIVDYRLDCRLTYGI